MERYYLSRDVKVFCIQATSFPDGIRAAFLRLRSVVEDMMDRDFFGIIYKTGTGQIIYKAAVTARPGESVREGCEHFILPSGEYLTEWLGNWAENEEEINKIFSLLAADPRIDHFFPCIEWYETRKDMLCMVKVKPAGQSLFSIDEQTGLIKN